MRSATRKLTEVVPFSGGFGFALVDDTAQYVQFEFDSKDEATKMHGLMQTVFEKAKHIHDPEELGTG